MWYLLLLASSTTPVCAKLQNDFDSHEKFWSMLYPGINTEVQQAGEMLAITGAVRERIRLDKARDEASKFEREMSEKADRIVTLMIAHKCTPPDHVASPFTHLEKDQSSE